MLEYLMAALVIAGSLFCLFGAAVGIAAGFMGWNCG